MLNLNGMIYILFIFFTHYKLLQADNTDAAYKLERLSTVVNNDETPKPADCMPLLNKFADASANFTKCSIKHARPVRLCEKCIDHYVSFRDKYQALLKKDDNGTSCKEIFISHDTLDVVLGYYNNIMSVWNKGNCNGCYNWTNGAPELSNNTIKFYKFFNDTIDCIRKNLTPDETNYTKVCDNCMHSYLQLNNFYESLSYDPIGLDNICMDVVDSVSNGL
ncbi:hypothetical protein O3G_MSEX000635, partial [Manduca sexta]